MAQTKKTEEVRADEEMAAEVAEVREDPETPDDREDAGSNSLNVGEVATAAEADRVDVDESELSEDGQAEAHTAKAGRRSAKALREAATEEARQAAKIDRAEAQAEEGPKPSRRQQPNPLHMHGKKFRAALEQVDRSKLYGFEEALALAVKTSTTKFDSSVELHINLGVDPRQADQMVRSTIVLPHGTGKSIKVAVFADGAAAEAARAAGADMVGTDELLADIEAGKLNFDLLIATPDKMATLGRVARVLGPRGLMPNPKSGTVTPDAAKAVTEAKAGKVEFRIDRQGIIHQAVGKASFEPAKLLENATTLVQAILRAKPAATKGTYVKAISIASSMGPGVKVDAAATVAAISGKR